MRRDGETWNNLLLRLDEAVMPNYYVGGAPSRFRRELLSGYR
jgi:hypothetical protein